MKIKPYNDFTGGLNLNQSSNIKDNQFVVAKNMFYNNSQQIQSRRGYRKFGNNVGSAPITSYFFFQRDDTLESIAIMFSGGVMYKYDESGNTWTSIKTGLFEFETLPGETNKRTRWDFAVYKNVIYMCDGVNTYASFDGTTYTSIGVGSAITGTTGDNTTDTFTKSTHGLVDGDEVYLSLGTLPTGITSGQVYYVIGSTANTFKISTSKNGSAVNFTTNGSGFSVYKLSQPRCRYISYLFNAIFGAGSDGAPSTLYHTEGQPLDGNNISYTEVVIGGDEIGRINGISEHGQLVTVFKDQKIYTYLPGQEVNPIDSQTGGYSDRTIHSIGNTLAYFNERGIDALQNRSGVGGVSAIESKPLSDNVRSLIELIKADNYRSCVSWYIKETNNYYFSFDTNGDDIPDTTLVYNSLVGAWTEYIYPEIYDYGWYIDSDGDRQYIITSGSGGQCFEYEYGYDDVGTKIETELQTKPRDNDDPAQVKEYSFVDVTGRKEDTEEPLNIDIIVGGEVIRSVTVDSSNLNTSEQSIRISTTPISIAPVGGGDDINDNKILYKYSVKIPLYSRGIDMSVRLSASGVQWILEKIRVGYDNSTIELFNYNNIK